MMLFRALVLRRIVPVSMCQGRLHIGRGHRKGGPGLKGGLGEIGQ
jgi:hypothetical protein